MEIRNDSVQVLARHHSDMLHLGTESGAYAMNRVFSSHFNRLQKLDAYTLVPVPGKADRYRTVRATDFKEKFDMQQGVFF